MIRLAICNELFENWALLDVCRLVKSIGYEGLELAPFTLAPTIFDLSSAQRAEANATIEGEGLAVVGLHWLLAKTEGLYLTSPDPDVRRRTGDYLAELARATRELGGALMVLGSPKQRDLLPGVDHDQATEFAAEVLGGLIGVLDDQQVDLCLEPLAPSETTFLNTCDQANALVARLGSPRVKLHMDVKAQSGEAGRTVPDLIKEHAARAGHFHAQDTNLRGPGMGAVDFGPILEALVKSGYDRWASVEVFDYSPGAEATARASHQCLREGLDRAIANR